MKFYKYWPLGFIAIIVLISRCYHFKIHIIDMLSLSMVPDFDVAISIERILFEPFLGLILFFNRAYYGISEMVYLLLWIIGIFIAYSIIRSILSRDSNSFIKKIISIILNTPIVTGLCFVLFLLMLFIPLPNNTLVNHSKNDVIVSTHSHTHYSHDGLTSQMGQWNWHKRNGFDAFFITDHNNHFKTLEFIKAQQDGVFSNEPLVMCGEEFSGSNHLSLLGIKNGFSTKGSSDSLVIASVHAQNGVVIVNHWFDAEHNSLEHYKNLGADGFEIENSGEAIYYNRDLQREIRSFCEDNNLVMISGLDFHGYGNVCMMWNAFEIPYWDKMKYDEKEAAILNIMKSRDQSSIKTLLYNDRPYYSSEMLWLSPLSTVFNYFRTLNYYQLLSWLVWTVLFMMLKNWMSHKPKLVNQIKRIKWLGLAGIIGASFILSLGLYYFLQIQDDPNFSEIYKEYSNLLLYTGGAFLIYSMAIFFFKNRKSFV